MRQLCLHISDIIIWWGEAYFKTWTKIILSELYSSWRLTNLESESHRNSCLVKHEICGCSMCQIPWTKQKLCRKNFSPNCTLRMLLQKQIRDSTKRTKTSNQLAFRLSEGASKSLDSFEKNWLNYRFNLEFWFFFSFSSSFLVFK